MQSHVPHHIQYKEFEKSRPISVNSCKSPQGLDTPRKLHDANVGQNTPDGNLVSFVHLIAYRIVFLEAERGPLILTSKRAVGGSLSVVEEIDVQ